MTFLSWLRYLLLIFLTFPLCSSSCMGQASPRTVNPPPLKIVTTFSILGNIVQIIGGDKITVQNIVSASQDPHVFEPTINTTLMLNRADGIFINGLGLEGWFSRLIQASGFKGEVFVATQGITGRHDPLNPQNIDPHAWHSLEHIKRYAKNIAQQLAILAPQHQAYFAKNAADFCAQCDTLTAWAHKTLLTIPKKNRIVVTAHDAFHYLGQEFNIIFAAPQGTNTASEPSAQDIARIISFVRQHKIKVVFIETLANPRLLTQLSTEAGATIGGTLYTDALSDKTGPAPDYLSMMRHNLSLMFSAMQGDTTTSGKPCIETPPAITPHCSDAVIDNDAQSIG